jgi:hypothetical protein
LPADATAAHVRRLLAAGATACGIASAAGVSPSVVSALGRGAKRAVRRDTAGKILAVAMDRAQAPDLATGLVPDLGHAQPLAWDDDQIDDPSAQPSTAAAEPVADEVAVERALATRSIRGLAEPDRLAAAARARAQGAATAGALAHRLGTSAAVARRLLRLLEQGRAA